MSEKNTEKLVNVNFRIPAALKSEFDAIAKETRINPGSMLGNFVYETVKKHKQPTA